MRIDSELAKLCHPPERGGGAPCIAESTGATHLCLFVCDPELDKFLPAPGFPQTFPLGLAWRDFLRAVAHASEATDRLQSPFSGEAEAVTGFLLGEDVIAVFFGEQFRREAFDEIGPGLSIIAALLVQEVRARMADGRAAFSEEIALESRKLADALSRAHDRLAESMEEREKLADQLRSKEERLQLASQIAGMGVWEVDLAGRSAYLAEETAALFGLPAGEFRGSVDVLLERIHPEDRERVRQEMGSALASTGEYSVQFRVVWPDGTLRWLEDRARVMGDLASGQAIIIGASVDVTNRVLTEKALVRSEQLAAAGRLAASIAHEINNPLEGLTNLIYLAKTETDPAALRELLTIADGEIIRISSVARQALGFYREVRTPVRFDLSSIVREVLEIYSKQILEAGLEVRVEYASRAAEIEGSPGEIKQTVANLLINAVHASQPGSEIRVRVSRTARGIQLSIGDRGHGIASEHMSQIFEPFFSTKKSSGTGLGLWVARQIAHKHGGWIRARSRTTAAQIGTTRTGTVFMLCFPSIRGESIEVPDEQLSSRWEELRAKSA